MDNKLQIRKIYVDSRFETAGNASSNDFEYDLPESISLPDNVICYLDDIVIPHSQKTIAEYNNEPMALNDNYNSTLYFIPMIDHTDESKLKIKVYGFNPLLNPSGKSELLNNQANEYYLGEYTEDSSHNNTNRIFNDKIINDIEKLINLKSALFNQAE